ncbi:MAG TPA: Ig-like domain-containing protein, partial [Spirochaetota bacterium]|nr:Ig-like domain-containing protein [Spirochaetota bacterium]
MKYQLFFLSKLLSFAVVFSLLFSACGKESQSVTPADDISSLDEDLPGTLAITGAIAYPAPAETDVPVNSKIVLIFSHDILPASVNSTNITISPAVAGIHTYNTSGHIITITLANPMSVSTSYTVSTNTNLLALSDSRHVSQSYSWSFTTAPNNTDNYQPRVIIRSPMGAGIPINRNYIEVTFNEDVSNVTMATFTISGGAAVSGVTNVAGTNTWRLNLSASLAYNTLYTVDLTNAITDAAGNTLLQDGMDTWNFQTELAPGANPALTLSNNFVGNVTDTSADLSWQTSYAVDNSIVTYGIDTTYPATASNVYSATGESQLFSVSLLALTPGTVYYYRIELPGATPNFLEGNFYSKNTVIPGTQIASGANSALTALQLKLLSGAEDGSSAVMYSDGTNSNVSFFNSAGILDWQDTIDNNSMTSIGIFSDYSGGFFLSGINGGNVFLKRISNSDSFYYSHNDSTGLTVAAGNSSSVGVTYGGQGDPNVYPGFVQNNNVASGTATIPAGALNAFFDFDSDFTAGAFASVDDGDVVVERSGGFDGTTVNKTGSNYRHAMGQTLVSIAPGNLYQFADFATTDSFTARNHTINNYDNSPVAIPHISGSTVYSPHGWTSPAWLGLNDVVFNGTNYGLVNAAPSPIDLFGAALLSGNTYVVINTPACDYFPNQLVPQGGSIGYFAVINPGYLVINTTDAARVSSPTTTYFDDADMLLPYDYKTDALNLDAGIFDSAVSRPFAIYDKYCVEDIVSLSQIQPFMSVGLDITAVSGDTATFYDAIAGATGTADTPPVNPLYYDGYDFSAVNNNDIILNTSNYGAAAAVPNFSMINNIAYMTSGALGMNTTTASISDADNFRIIRFADPLQR